MLRLYYLIQGSSAMAYLGAEGCYLIRRYYLIGPYYLVRPFLRYQGPHLIPDT